MESHILNSYHQARYRIIGQVVRSTSNSVSSEGSNQNSPEYPQSVNYNRSFEEESNDGEYWDQGKKTDWNQKHLANAAQNNMCSSDEEDVNIEVQEVTVDEKESEINSSQYISDNLEDNSLVEGDDYDVIQVYAVHPDLDLEEASTDDETQKSDEEIVETVENFCVDSQGTKKNYLRKKSLSYDGLSFNLDTPVVSNVDEYFIKAEKEKQDNILEVKDEPIVYDVDEFFIKNAKKVPNVDDDFLVKTKLLEDHSSISEFKNVATVDEFIVNSKPILDESVKFKIVPDTPTHSHALVTETDSEVIPKIEELKKFLLDETLSYSKFKNMQRSCSVPHSPLHNICMDIEEAKTCLSFEDLNLDLSDLAAFDTDKDKSLNKSEDPPQTLTEEDVNSFLITDQKLKQPKVIHNEDDFNPRDMELDCPIESLITHDQNIKTPTKTFTSTPQKAKVEKSVLDFCIEKPETKVIKKELVEVDDFVDVESCNDTVIPVLAANNLNSLLEQFEANEKLNVKKKHAIKIEDPKVVKNTLTNGTRLQDAGVQLNKNKMRHILMPTTINATITRSPSPVHSDHDYCSSKKRHGLPNLKGGQSLLKPEVLSSNNRILNSRHRSCKNKKVVYHLSSDDESEKSNNKNKKLPTNKNIDLCENKVKKLSVKAMIKPPEPPNCRKKIQTFKLSNSEPNTNKCKSNNSVILKNASKASDTPSSQNQNVSIKLTIKNKCEVILNHCDDEKDSQKNKCISKDSQPIASEKFQEKTETIKLKSETVIKAKNETHKVLKTENIKTKSPLDSNKNVSVSVKNEHTSSNVKEIKIKEENRPTVAFYNALFSNKQDVQLPTLVEVKCEKRSVKAETKAEITDIEKIIEQPQKKKKLNLQEYKMRKCASSASSSAAVSPEAIFPEMPNQCSTLKPLVDQNPTESSINNTAQINSIQEPKKIFDPIREASRKILAMTKKSKAEAIRKRDEDIVMRKIPKVENLELQPLISDAEMMKIVGMANVDMLPIKTEKPQIPSDYEEIILVSVGTNTDENVFTELAKQNKPSPEKDKIKPPTPPADSKGSIHFKIKKNDHVLKQNVFDKRRNLSLDSKHDSKINQERYKDITATLKTVGKQVDNKILSNSLFSSIQDVVLKKAPEKNQNKDEVSIHKQRNYKTLIVREYDLKADHGEDKIILHLGKYRTKPDSANINVQTEQSPELIDSAATEFINSEAKLARKRTESDMSMSSEGSPVQMEKSPKNKISFQKYKDEVRHESDKRAKSKDRRSRSRDRYNRYRSTSRSRRRRKSYSRSRSRSHGRFKRYRRSDSPYRRKRRSRSPYRSRHRSRSSDTRPKSRLDTYHTKSSVAKAKPKTTPSKIEDVKAEEPMTPPIRKSTVSESSETSRSSTSSSSSDDSRISRRSMTSKRSRSRSITPKGRRSTSQKSGDSSSSKRKSCTPRKRSGSLIRRSSSPYGDVYKKGFRSAYSSEDRESNTPVEERRIVFVGKLEKDITKAALRAKFTKFGPVVEVRLHTKDDGTRYGFVTFALPGDAWRVVGAAAAFPQYDVGFGGRRAFCRHSYADLDGIEARYSEGSFHGQPAPAPRGPDLTFEQMLLDMKNKLSQRKGDKKPHVDGDA